METGKWKITIQLNNKKQYHIAALNAKAKIIEKQLKLALCRAKITKYLYCVDAFEMEYVSIKKKFQVEGQPHKIPKSIDNYDSSYMTMFKNLSYYFLLHQ